MKQILAFLLLASLSFAQCGPGGCPPGYCPPQQQWCPQHQPDPYFGIGDGVGNGGIGIGIGAGTGQGGIGIGAGFVGTPAPNLVPQHPAGAVVRITDGMPTGFTGVNIDPSGIVLTAKHCLMGKPLTVEFGKQAYLAQIAFVAQESEGPVVLKLNSSNLPFARVARSITPNRSPCYSVGFPGGGYQQQVHKGYVRGGGWWTCKDLKNYPANPGDPGAWQSNQTSFGSVGGESGGPLFDENSEVIGLLSASGGATSIFISWAATRAAADQFIGQAPQQGPDFDPAPAPPDLGEPAPIPPSQKPRQSKLEEDIEAIRQHLGRPQPIDLRAIAESVSHGNQPLVEKFGQALPLLEKLGPALEAAKNIAPAVGVSLPAWLPMAAATGPVGLGIWGASMGISLLLKLRRKNASGQVAGAGVIDVQSLVEGIKEHLPQLDHGKLADVISKGNGGLVAKVQDALKKLESVAVVGQGSDVIARLEQMMERMVSAGQSNSSGPTSITVQPQGASITSAPQIVPVKVNSEEWKLACEAMAHVAANIPGGAKIVQDIESAMKQLKAKVPLI